MAQRRHARRALTSEPVKYKNRSSDSVTIIGTTEQFLHTSGITIAEGRFLSPAEAEGGRPVCVIGATWPPICFHGESPLGQKIVDRPAAL